MNSSKLFSLVISALLLTAGSAWAGGDAAAGKDKAANCAGCHGANGEGMGDNPPIAGMEKAAFVAAMEAYKSGERENAMMQMFAQQLAEEDFHDLAAYYASLSAE